MYGMKYITIEGDNLHWVELTSTYNFKSVKNHKINRNTMP